MQTMIQPSRKFAAAVCFAILTCAAGLPCRAEQTSPKDVKVRTVAILVFNGMDIQDFAGPADVFFYGAASSGGEARFKQYAVAKTMEPITSQGFVKIVPNHTFADCPQPDILVVPGGAVNALMNDEETVKWIREAGAKSQQVLSVCTGALVLHKAGFLEGQKATTHWGAIDRLREQAPNTTVVENVRYVDNGQVITSSGVSAGIDMALHVVAKLIGLEAAENTARRMEYEWKPREDYPAAPAQE